MICLLIKNIEHLDNKLLIKLANDYLTQKLDREGEQEYELHIKECETCEYIHNKLIEIDILLEEAKKIPEKRHIRTNEIEAFIYKTIDEKELKEIESHLSDCKYCSKASILLDYLINLE